jgi:hypothetical protein
VTTAKRVISLIVNFIILNLNIFNLKKTEYLNLIFYHEKLNVPEVDPESSQIASPFGEFSLIRRLFFHPMIRIIANGSIAAEKGKGRRGCNVVVG